MIKEFIRLIKKACKIPKMDYPNYEDNPILKEKEFKGLTIDQITKGIKLAVIDDILQLYPT